MENTNLATPMPAHDNAAYHALKFGFVVAPVVAGVDKFFNFLTDWTLYLAPSIPAALNTSSSDLMMGVGIIEIVAGLGVLFKPKVFAFIICAWLVAIIANLLVMGNFYDIALRDLGLAIGAFALGELSVTHEKIHVHKKIRTVMGEIS